MSTLILDKVLSGYNLAKVNDNFERIEKAFNEALLHRDGSKSLTNDLDVNSQKLLNVAGIEIGGVDITQAVSQLRTEYEAIISGISEYQLAVDEILQEAISYGAVDQKSIGNAQRVFTTTQSYAANANLTLPLPYVVGKNTLHLNMNHYYDMFKGVDYEEVGTVNTQSTTIKLLKPVSSGVQIEEWVDGDNDLYSIYTTAEALQDLLTTSYSPESIEAFISSVSDINELGLEDKITEMWSIYNNLTQLQVSFATTVADINTKYSTITDMYEDVGTKYSLLESLYPQLLALLSDTDFDLDDLNSAIGDLNDAIEDINEAMEDVQGYAEAASDDADAAASSASDAADSALEAAGYVSTINTSVNNARIWAEGTDEEVTTLSGTHSAKEWANRAGGIASNVSITATGSTGARTLADRFADIINVKDYGAKGDGTTDDTAAIQAAITAADGHVVFFPIGVYIVNGGLTVSDSCEITGYGATIKQMTQASEYTLMVSSADVTIKDINFVNNSKQVGFASDASRQVDHCIKTTAGADNLTISGCSFSGFRGCVVPTTGNSGLIKNLTVENCTFEHYDYALLLDDFDGCSIVNCTGRNIDFTTYLLSDPASSNDPPHLLYVTDRSGTAKRNLRVVNCLEVGNAYSSSYKVRNTNGVTISNNVSDGCCRGIEIDQCWNVVVTGNSITNMVTTDSSIAGTDNQQSGIWLSDVKGSVVSGNFIDCSANGVSIYGMRLVRAGLSTEIVESQDILVEGNEIVSNMSVYAFTVALLKNSSIRNNSVISTNASSNTYMCYLSGCDGVVVENGFCKGFPLALRFVSFNDGTWDGDTVQSQNNVAVTNTYTIPVGSNLICSFNGTGTNKADVRKGTEYIPERASVSLPALRSPTAEHTGIYCSSTYLMVAVQNASNATANAMRFNWSSAGYPSIDAYGRVVPSSDNSFPLGLVNQRWSNVYAANAVIDNIGASSATATGSTTARTLASRFADVINVRDFGAKGDGTTDDRQSIQTALNKGGLVYFPAGTYRIASADSESKIINVSGNRSVNVICSPDAKFILDDSLSQLTAGVFCFDTGVSPSKENLSSFSWQGGVFDFSDVSVGAEYGLAIFDIYRYTNPTVRDVTFDAGYSTPSSTNLGCGAIDTAITTHNCFGGVIENNTFIGFYDTGIYLSGDNDAGVYNSIGEACCVQNNVFRRCNSGIVYKRDFLGVNVSNNFFFECGNGIAASRADSSLTNHGETAVISNNRFKSIQGYPVRCETGSGYVITGNVIVDFGKYLYDSSINTPVSSGNFIGGITLRECADGVVSDNVICAQAWAGGTAPTGGQIYGISLTTSDNGGGCSRIAVNDNLVSDVQGTFFESATCSNNVFDNNTYHLPSTGTALTENILGTDTIFSAIDADNTVQYIDADVHLGGTQTTASLSVKKGVSGGAGLVVAKASGYVDIHTDTTNAALRFTANGTGQIQLRNATSILGNVGPATSNTYSCGWASRLWSEVFAATATINTSDERLKDNISGISDAVLDAWGDVNLIVFQFKDAIEKKGQDARIHAGVIAQQVQRAFEAKGLDAFRFGLLCYDKWEAQDAVLDEDGNEIEPAQEAGDRYSIRYEEALILEAAFQRRRADRIEARLQALEERLNNAELVE